MITHTQTRLSKSSSLRLADNNKLLSAGTLSREICQARTIQPSSESCGLSLTVKHVLVVTNDLVQSINQSINKFNG